MEVKKKIPWKVFVFYPTWILLIIEKSVTDRWTEGQTDGWARSFCGGELNTIEVIDIGLSMMFDFR